MLQPVLVHPAPPPAPTAWSQRLREIVAQRRLPYRVRSSLDRCSAFLGFRHKTIHAGGLRLKVRRLTDDERIIHRVIEEKEYFIPGYEPGMRDTVIDIGGNIGAFALAAAQRAREGRVFSFEPSSANYRLLVHNVALNRFPHIVTEQSAVMDKPGNVRLYLDANSSGGPSTTPERVRVCGEEEVPGKTLSDVFDAFGIAHCNLLKVDCEGAEFPILLSCPIALFSRIDRIALEYHVLSRKHKHQEVTALIDHLTAAGYRVDLWTDVVGSNQGLLFASRLPR